MTLVLSVEGNGLAVPTDTLPADASESLDHFVQSEGLVYAGNHIIVDLWGASRLDDLQYMEATLRSAIQACKATLLHIHLHHFTPTGISGVAVLAESHISVHTWPERGFAAFDVFMCGQARPELAIPIFQTSFAAERTDVHEIKRGIVSGKLNEVL